MAKKSIDDKIKDMYSKIAAAERELEKAEEHRRSILEVGLKALRDELSKLNRESRRRG